MKKKGLLLFVFCAGLSIMIFFCSVIVGLKARCPIMYKGLIEKYSKEYNVEKSLIYAIIKNESGFNTKSISKSGAIGLMQIMPATGEWISDELGKEFTNNILLDAETNIYYGTFFIRYLLDKYDSIEVMLFCYNVGEGHLSNIIINNGVIDYNDKYKAVQNYVKTVLDSQKSYEKCIKLFKNSY